MKRIVLLLGFLLSGYFVFSQAKTAAQQLSEGVSAANPVVHPSVVRTGHFLGVIGPVRDFPVLSEAELQLRKQKEAESDFERNEELRERNYPNAANALPKGPDPVWQKSIPSTKSITPEILLDFDGGSGQGYPTDVNGSAGPNHYMQAYNLQYMIFDKDGNTVAGPTDMNTLFNGVTGAQYNDGDPIVLYDENADRWFAAEFSVSGNNDYMLIAVSVTNDPTGQWYAYSFDVDDMPDYMKFGVWRDGYYMADNNSSGNDIYVFERDVMLQGGSNPKMVGFDNPNRPNSGFHTLQPLDNDGQFAPDGTPGMFITINDDAWGGGGDELWLFELNVDWNNTSNSTFQRTQVISVPSFDSEFNTSSYMDDITQEGTSQKLDAIPQVLMYRAQYRNFGNEQTIVACHTVDVDGTDHAGIRWYELTNTGSGWTLRQSGTYAPDATNRWMGSIAMNSHHQIAIAYSVAGSNTYTGLRLAGQSAAEHANASGVLDIPETVIVDGQGAQTNTNRWGDYFEMSVDPTDDFTFWFTGQYVSSSTSLQTRVVEFRFPELGDPINLSANAVSDSEIDVTWGLNDNNDPVLLAWSPDGTFGTPQNGTTYSPGDTISGGGIVLYYGTNTSYNHTGLQPSTTYYYKAWSYLSTNEYSPGVVANATTEASPVTSYPFTWDFENSSDWTTSFDPWTTVDGDGKSTYQSSDCDWPGEGSAFAYMAFNTADCWESSQGDAAHSGVRVGMADCPSDASQSDDWFISPKLQLGTNSTFSFWALSPKPGSWGDDEFEVLVSTTDNNPSSFTAISQVTAAPDTGWAQFTYDLSAYDNQEIYVAIHHVSTDKFMLWIDDLEVNSTINCTQPAITTQPNSQTVCEGESVTFSVVADATAPVYQWQLNGNDIPGATSDTYTINSVTTSDAGDYTVVITDSCGNTITSNAATLTVNPSVAITTQPQGGTVCTGESFTFNVVASGSNLTYQWQKDGNDISGATSDTYTISNVSANDAGDYTVVVSGDCGSITSNVATLNVNQSITITSQPEGGDVCEGGTFTFTVTATGDNPTYQWQHNGNDISGATSYTYTISNATVADSGTYTCVISNSCGTVTTQPVTLTVSEQPAITTQPQGGTVCEGESYTFSVSVTGGAITYQWQKDGVDIPGATSNTYTISNVSSNDAGDYTVVVGNDCGSLTSNAATLTVNPLPDIISQPQGGDVCEGEGFTFTVVANGNNLTYQWQHNGNNISGATTNTYTISAATVNDGGSYNCLISNDCGTVTTYVVTLNVNEQPVITTQPVDVSINEGDNFTLNVEATGTNLSYQWYKDGNAVVDGGNISGATTATLSVTNATVNDEGWYNCQISNTCGNVTSDSAHVVILVDISEADAKYMSVSPNPTNGQLYVVSNQAIDNIVLVTMDGREVKAYDTVNSSNFRFDISDLAKGVYIVKVKFADGHVARAKVIKK
jgi:hypothetical protein